MNITIQVSLFAGDNLTLTAQEIAEQFLTDVGANPERDVVNVTVTDTGQAGGSTVVPADAPPPVV